jgi:archaellum component FlaC
METVYVFVIYFTEMFKSFYKKIKQKLPKLTAIKKEIKEIFDDARVNAGKKFFEKELTEMQAINKKIEKELDSLKTEAIELLDNYKEMLDSLRDFNDGAADHFETKIKKISKRFKKKK